MCRIRSSVIHGVSDFATVPRFLSTSLDQPDENGNTTISGDTTIMTFREFKIKDGSIANKQEHT